MAFQDEMNKALWSACQSSRGSIEAADYKNYFLAILFLKYLTDVAEEGSLFTLPPHCSFNYLFEHRYSDDIGAMVNHVLSDLSSANGDQLTGVFTAIDFDDEAKLGKNKHSLVRGFLESFHGLDLSTRNVQKIDVIGNAYEYLLGHFAAGAGKKAGEFFTPPGIAELMVRLVEPLPGEAICDPTCGSGSLLIRCGNHIRQNGASDVHLFGQEITRTTWSLAKMNMVLHGLHHSKIAQGNVLKNPLFLNPDGNLMKFDVIVANPPFSIGRWRVKDFGGDPFGRFRRGVPPQNRGDYAFITHIAETLKKNGRAAVVASNGVLFRGRAELPIRKALLEEGMIEAVIQLPQKLFYGTKLPSSILVLRKSREIKDVLIVDARQFFKRGKKQDTLCEASIERIVEIYKRRRSETGISALASFEDIKKNRHELNVELYVAQPDWPVDDLLETYKALVEGEANAAASLSRVKEVMKRLGHDI